jgi:hypothetical protein
MGEYGPCGRLECDAVSRGISVPTFREIQPYSSTMVMKAARFSETSVRLYEFTPQKISVF